MERVFFHYMPCPSRTLAKIALHNFSPIILQSSISFVPSLLISALISIYTNSLGNLISFILSYFFQYLQWILKFLLNFLTPLFSSCIPDVSLPSFFSICPRNFIRLHFKFYWYQHKNRLLFEGNYPLGVLLLSLIVAISFCGRLQFSYTTVPCLE